MSYPIDLERYITAQLSAKADRWLLRTAAITLEAAERYLVIEQGRRFYLPIEWIELRDEGTEAAYDLTGWAFTFTVRDRFGGSALLTLSTAATGITIAEGLIKIDASPTVTGALTGWSVGVYDLVATKTGEAVRLLKGSIELSLKVTT